MRSISRADELARIVSQRRRMCRAEPSSLSSQVLQIQRLAMDMAFGRGFRVGGNFGRRQLHDRPMKRTTLPAYRRCAVFSNGQHAEALRPDSAWGFIVARAPNDLGWQTSMGVTASAEVATHRMSVEVIASERYGVEVTLAEIVPVAYRMFDKA
jgi:hypothetical protein